jgi:CRISPR-associated protein Csb3
MNIKINVDPTNPGQFFACCGLLELADRLWTGAQGWFEGGAFCVNADGSLADLMTAVASTTLLQCDPENDTSSSIKIQAPFRPLILDWWHDIYAGGKELKVWAGTMESVRIACAMQHAMRAARFHSPGMFDIGLIAYDPVDANKKVEPYYFDARRGPNAHSRDVGFAPNDLGLTTTAFPAVELLCLVGLQRCQPQKTEQRRIYDYFTWAKPLPPELLPAAVTGELGWPDSHGYRFENWYRTSQRKHKAFRSAIPHSKGD